MKPTEASLARALSVPSVWHTCAVAAITPMGFSTSDRNSRGNYSLVVATVGMQAHCNSLGCVPVSMTRARTLLLLNAAVAVTAGHSAQRGGS